MYIKDLKLFLIRLTASGISFYRIKYDKMNEIVIGIPKMFVGIHNGVDVAFV